MITVTDIINKLTDFWNKHGVSLFPTYDLEMGAATCSPFTFFNVLSGKNSKFMYLQPCRRKADARYGESPNRLVIHHQFQVVLQPFPENIIDLYYKSLEHIGFDLSKHDIRFFNNNWNSASLGASGVGWEVRVNGMEITQYTYFQQLAQRDLKNIPCEIAYGVERLAVCINKKDIYNCMWDKDFSYRDMFYDREVQLSIAYLEKNIITENQFHELHEKIQVFIKNNLFIPAYEHFLKLNEIFNELDAIKILDEFSRKKYIGMMQKIVSEIDKLYSNKIC